MNHVYRIVWSASAGAFQVVSELAQSNGAKSGTTRKRRRSMPAVNVFATAAVLAAMSNAASAATIAGTIGSSTLDLGVLSQSLPDWIWTGVDLAVASGATVTAASQYGAVIQINGVIGTLSNAGTLSGGTTGVMLTGSAASLDNSSTGLITGTDFGVDNIGSIASITNDGTISTTGPVTHAIFNTGTIGEITNNGLLSAPSGIYNQATIGSITNTGTIIASVFNGIGNLASIGSVDNSGYISGATGAVWSENTIGTVINSGTLSGGPGLYNTGTIDLIDNSGLIAGIASGSYQNGVYNGGTIGTLTNSGLITGNTAVHNTGTIGTLINNGTISGSYAITNDGTIGTLTNSGTIDGGAAGISVAGTIGSMVNNGTIHATAVGIANSGTIGSLSNAGTLSAAAIGIDQLGTIATLTNSGLISGSNIGIYNFGTIGAVTNSGLISSVDYAIFNYLSGSIGTIVNSGTIAGAIVNDASSDLNIDGATGSASGTLTGYNDTVGTITNTRSDVIFGTGNLLLNDDINLGTTAHTVYNTGSTLEVDTVLTITGNYSQSAAATLLIGVTSGAIVTGSLTDSGYGRLIVTGDATIAAGSSVSLKSTTGGYAFAAGQRFVVVDATGSGTHYNATALNYAVLGYTGSVTGTSVTTSGHTDLVLTLGTIAASTGDTTTTTDSSGTTGTTSGSGTTTTTVAPTTSNARNAINGLRSYTGVSDAALLNLYNAGVALQTYGNVASVNRAGAQLAPISQAATAQAAAASTDTVLDIVSTHLDGIRLAQNESASGVSTGEGTLANGVWGQVFGGHASRSESSSVDGYSANFAGMMFGVDRAVSDRWRAGGVFSYSNGAINNTGDTAGDTTRVNSYGLLGYGSYTANRWYANVSAGAVMQRYDSTRQVDFTGFSGSTGASFGGAQYVIRAEAGMPLNVGPMVVTPLAALTYSYLHQNSYTENGGNGAALAVGAAHATSVRSDLGAKLSRDFTTSYGVVVPDLTLAWRHEYDNTRTSTAASYAADPTGATSFTTLGSSPVTNLADLSVGATLLRASNLSLTVRYEVQAGKGYVSQAGSLKLRQLF
ncbi:autotransporter domain-containing protein [Paraburkholderia sp.]|uniref:autotransporter domain-containing protein n=1 Tax=Paraburkholderia sp. TaxID=1926495 RepID=UPI00238650C1|nr:autotransporter domain-containing protein [Paraburkholderia sp.]MDE1181860.1 autotransporter domain-containing protein [Paraburkholderia sp.]